MLMSLFNSSFFGVTFGLGAAWVPAVVCYRDEEGTASVAVLVSCDGDEEGETSITFSTSDESDSLLPEMKVKNKENDMSNTQNNHFSVVGNQ